MSRTSGTVKNDRVARSLFGPVYDTIPKSVFAAIAWHLANQSSGTCDAIGAAEAQFLREWKALLPHGISPPSKSTIAAMLKDATP